MTDKEILYRRMNKIEKNIKALDSYKYLIDEMLKHHDIYDTKNFALLKPSESAVLDAYLKRFGAIQDFLGAKIFPALLEYAGIPSQNMTETLYHAVKEGLIDSLESWIAIRKVRNDLEHDYPDELQEALKELRFCIDQYFRIKEYYKNAINFFQKQEHRNAII